MIDHLSFYATDFERTQLFYDAALATLGYERNTNLVTTWDPEWPTRRACAWGKGGKATFWVIEVREPSTPRHLAFASPDHASVEAFHRAALAAGGKDNGPPGPRPHYHPKYFGSFVLDPDGNNVEAVCHT